MSVEIESVTIGAETERRLVLTNAQWAATMNLGTDWNTLRVGARMALDDTGGNITGTPRLYLGLTSSPTSGLTNGPLSGASTKHFIGLITQGTQFTRSGSPLSYNVSSDLCGTKVGNTITGGGAAGLKLSAVPDTARIGTIVQIEKGSPNFTVRVSFFGGTVADHTLVTMLSAMDVEDFTAAAGVLGQSAVSGTLAVDEATNGFFNALCVAWNRSASTLHVSEMFFSKFA